MMNEETDKMNKAALLQASAHAKALAGDHSECIVCSMCGNEAATVTAHYHQDRLIGDECCWDERLCTTE